MTQPSSPSQSLQQERYEFIRKTLGSMLEEFSELLALELQHNPKHHLLRDLENKVQLARRKWQQQRFQVAVLALVKSGKSTLINALMGEEYLPATNTPETARIVRIRHRTDAGPGALLEKGTVKAAGAEAIRTYLKSLNDEARQKDQAPLEDEVVLEAQLQALTGRALGDHHFELLDTPGPNEAGTQLLKGTVERVLSEADVIIYVLDYSKLKTAEEQQLLELLRDMRPELLQRFSERLFFVVNKIDMQNRNGLPQKETAAYVAALLKNQLNLRIASDRILPLSAENALLARLVAGAHPSEKALNDFVEEAFGTLREDEPDLATCRQLAPTLLKKSRLPQLEDQIVTFIYEHRARLFLQSFVEDLERFLGSFDNHLLTAQETLRQGHAQLIGRVDELKKEVARITAGLQELSATSEGFKRETEAWVRDRFDKFKAEARSMIEAALNPRAAPPTRGRLKALLQQVQALLGFEGRDEAAIRSRAQEVHFRIERHLREEFRGFEKSLEQEAHERQAVLFSKLNRLIEPLARQVEDKVGRTLNIKLHPVPIRMSMPSLDEFAGEINGRLSSFIQQRQVREERVEYEDRLVRKGGWCSDDVYERTPVTRHSYQTTHSIAVDLLLAAWSKKIDDMTEVSVRTARAVIDQVIIQTLEKARQEIDRYSAGLLSTIEQEIATSEHSKAERESRLGDVEKRRQALESIGRALREYRQELELEKQEPVFLSYNSADRAEVQSLAEQLESAGIPVWFDLWRIPPGASFQQELNRQLERTRVAVVCIGKEGFGPFQRLEQEQLVTRLVSHGCRIIPLVLSGCDREPELPFALGNLRRLDFRQSPPPFAELCWGINEALKKT